MKSSRASGRARGRAAPLSSLAATAVGLLLVAMFAGTALAQSPDASASIDPVATTATSPDAGGTDAVGTDAVGTDAVASPAATTLPDTATGDPRSDGTSSSVPLVLGLIAVAAAIVLAIGLLGAQSRTRRVREDDTRS